MIRIFVILYLIIKIGYQFVLNKIRDAQRLKPLPEEVSDVYDQERYQQFLSYKSEYRALSFKQTICILLMDIFILFTPFFSWFDHLNVYVSCFIVITILMIYNAILTYFVDYYSTFTIEEKYGMNKKTYKEFLKDYLLGTIFDYVFEVAMYGIIIFICEHISKWTNNFSISYLQSFGLVCILGIVLLIVIYFFSILSVVVLMKQYTFTDLEDEFLLSEIKRMLKGCKKKINTIKVYNESAKSTSKNAFVLKIPFFRMIAIADNFLNENAQNECLGVLAHEVGHLKHKKDIFNYSKYAFIVCIILFFVIFIPNASICTIFTSYVNDYFHLSSNCYYLYLLLLGMIFEPFSFILSVYSNFVTRKEEYEADQNAVKEGYAEDLIRLFKALSKDELVDVNPAPIIENIEYDHPGMVNRIRGLQSKS